MKKLLLVLSIPLFLNACKETNNTQNATTDTKVSETKTPVLLGPTFNENNAFEHIKTQVDFGPRVPGTEAHKKTADWLRDQLKLQTDHVIVQETQILLADNKTKVPCYNIVGSFNPAAKRRILLLAHWDTRPWADMDFKDVDKPIDGADDGGSGTAVLIELARLLKEQPLPSDIGVDILLVDVEDYAKSEWGTNAFAQGSQYWAKNPHIKGYTAEMGILLDMVGGANARFAVEEYSKQYANHVVTAVWSAAHEIGYGKYFVYERGGAISDDHIPINEIAKIPTIDIINQPKGSSTGFVGHWHKHDDNLSNIDVNTLKAVGQTLVQFLYGLKPTENATQSPS